MRATLVISRNPLTPAHGRTVCEVRRRHSIARLARQAHLDPRREPVIALVNGVPVLQRHWRSRRLRNGEVLAFSVLPQGGRGGSNPLQVVLMLAVAIAAPHLAALTGATGTALNVVTGVIGVAGSLLVNALIPAPKPLGPQAARELAAASPTYTLQAQGNAARLGAPIPVVYGRHLLFPDFAANPYSEFAGNELFLYQLFCIGQGAYNVEAIRIEDTPIGSYEDVTYELVQPGALVTLFPTAVTTSNEVSGQEALTGVALGPFVANDAGTQANAIAVDVVASRGLYYADDNGGLQPKTVTFTVEAREIDDLGVPVGGWVTLGAPSITGATATPQRVSYRYEVAPGRYEVRLTRTDTKDTNARAGHQLDWFGLRAYLPGTQAYGQVTLLAVRMRASNQLSQISSRRINVIVTRKLATRAAGQWTAEVTTRSIAWALADCCRNARYSVGYDDTRYDLAGLEALDLTWSARGDYFDGVFDSAMGFWEALTTIARAGRATPIRQGGRIYFIRDQALTLPSAVYSMRNIVRGSFSMRFLLHTDETPDGVVVEYFDAEVWKPRTVTCAIGGITPVRPARVKLFGVTTRAHAYREGCKIAADNLYRRTQASFQTELEGHVSTFWDLVVLQHDLPEWGQFGEVTAYDEAALRVVLSEPLTWSDGVQHYAAFRTRKGGHSGPYAVTQGGDARTLILDRRLDFEPYLGDRAERTQAVFGPSSSVAEHVRVTAVRPRGRTIEIAVVNEDARVHAADGSTPPAGETWGLPAVPTVPAIAGALLVVAGGTPANPTASLSWSAAAGAEYYLVEHGVDGVAWTRVAEISRTNFTMDVPAGTNHFRVAPIGKSRGAWVSWSGSITGDLVAPIPAPVPTGLAAFAGLASIILTWDDITNPQVDRIEVLRHTINDSAGAQVVATVRRGTRVWQDMIGSVGVTRWYWIRTVTKAGATGSVSSPATATTGTINLADTSGSITATQITDGAVTTPKLAANAVIAEKIAAGVVSADKMVAGTITAASGVLADAVITAAKIADLNVTAAKIADANVTTLKIAGNNVTVPIASYSGAAVGIVGTVLIAQPAPLVLPYGGGVIVTVTAQFDTTAGFSCAWALYVNGILLTPFYVAAQAGINQSATITWSAALGAGTYTFQVYGLSTSALASGIAMSVLGAQR